jgi:menaquinone-dependent protoporphyrinogen oxidase
MRALIVYGSTQGQTRKIAEYIAERWREEGHEVGVVDARRCDGMIDPAGYDATLVAASLHAGRYQPAVGQFIRKHAAALSRKPSAFVSVSLSAAGNDAGDRAGLAQCDEALFARTGWRPKEVHHAAGALAYTSYNFLLRWFMRRIAAKRGAATDTSRDYELTDYDALGRFVDRFIDDALPFHDGMPPGLAEARWAL